MKCFRVRACSVILVWLVIRLEEKELRARFGAAFDEHCARVPRLLPHGLTMKFPKELGKAKELGKG